MANLKDRMNKEVSATEAAVLNITGKAKSTKNKYPVNVVFDGETIVIRPKQSEDMTIFISQAIKLEHVVVKYEYYDTCFFVCPCWT